MCTVGHKEIVTALEVSPDESTVPRDIFTHLYNVYEEAGKGSVALHCRGWGSSVFLCGGWRGRGICTVRQEEIVTALGVSPDESTVPGDIFTHLFNVYEEAGKDSVVLHCSVFLCVGGGRGDVYCGTGGNCNSIRSESRREHCAQRYLYTSLQCV